MRKTLDPKLFWFADSSFKPDFSNQALMDEYVQQILIKGRTRDIRALLKDLDKSVLDKVFRRIQRFLPVEVRLFWEDFLAGH